jgi:hypothetical protein
MAAFDPISCQIVLTTGRSYSRADVAQIPTAIDVTMSLSHEYVHFLQAVSGLSGFRFLAELIDFGIHGALVVDGLANGHSGVISGYKSIFPMLNKQANRAGQAFPDIKSRATSILDEAHALFGCADFPYSGKRQPWDLDSQDITFGTYTEPFWGYVTPRGSFRPFTPGLLSEGMARRIDQWVKTNHGFAGHSWNGGVAETEHYNGLQNILRQPAYGANVTDATRDRVAVIVASLALVCQRPDLSTELMLHRLASPSTAGGLPATIAATLKDLLVGTGQLHADHHNEVMAGVLDGVGRIMSRQEWLPIHEQLKTIHKAANAVIADPMTFVDDTAGWGHLKRWMTLYSVPPVVAIDGAVAAVDGVPCTTTVTGFLSEVARVLL